MRRRKKEKTAIRSMEQLAELGLNRGVLIVFFCITALFGTAALLANFPASQPFSHSIILALGLPPALLTIAVGAFTSTLSQTLIDAFFLPVAIGYWLLIALAVDSAYRFQHRHLGKLALALSHQKTKIVK